MNKNICEVIVALSEIDMGPWFEPFIKYEASKERLNFGFRQCERKEILINVLWTQEMIKVGDVSAHEECEEIFYRLEQGGFSPNRAKSTNPVHIDLEQAPKSLNRPHTVEYIQRAKSPLKNCANSDTKLALIILFAFAAGTLFGALTK